MNLKTSAFERPARLAQPASRGAQLVELLEVLGYGLLVAGMLLLYCIFCPPDPAPPANKIALRAAVLHLGAVVPR